MIYIYTYAIFIYDIYIYLYTCLHMVYYDIYIYTYLMKCLGFARNRTHDRQRIIIIIIIIIISIIIIIILIQPLLKIFNECRSLAGVGRLIPYWRSSMNVEVQRGSVN